MKLLVIGDSHGIMGPVFEVIRLNEDIDAVIHLGDYARDAIEIRDKLGIEVIGVLGNCDLPPSRELQEAGFDQVRILELGGHRILICHGDSLGVHQDLNRLRYLCLEEGCSLGIFGHLHRASLDRLDGLSLLSPGSLTRPRDGSSGTYALVELGQDIDIRIVEHKKKKPIRGGYIKNLLNNSDRF